MVEQTVGTRRIREELREAGMTDYGLMKFGVRYVMHLIRDDEHIHGVVYGRYRSGEGILAMTEGMLIATDRRVMFIDHKPGFTDFDEITYDMVGGVRHQRFGPFNTVTLHTRMGDFAISYTNTRCSEIFTEYIESRRISRDASMPIITPATNHEAIAMQGPKTRKHHMPIPFLDSQSLKFLKEHDVAVLSTVDKEGNVSGAVVYYIVDQLNQIYIVTKSETKKATNILSNSKVALTIYDAAAAETLSIRGRADFEQDEEIISYVFNQIVQPKIYKGVKTLPPVTHLKKGVFTVIRIVPRSGKYIDYKQPDLIP